MSISLLKKQLKEGQFSNLYIFTGEEQYLQNYYLNKLKDKLIRKNLEELNFYCFEGKDIDIEKVDNAIEVLPIMSKYKMIVIKNSGILKAPASYFKEYWTERLKDIPEYVCLVFYENEIDKRSKIYKFIKKHGIILEFNFLKKVDLANWACRILNTYGKKISNQNMNYLIENSDEGMINLKNGIDKIINYSGNNVVITKEHIDAVCTKSIEGKLFEMIDALVNKNSNLTFNLLNDMITLKEPVIKILTLISRHFSKILKVKLMLNKGMYQYDIAKELKLSSYVTKKYINQAQHFSLNYIHYVLNECLKVDNNIKTGKINDWTALQVFLANLCI